MTFAFVGEVLMRRVIMVKSLRMLKGFKVSGEGVVIPILQYVDGSLVTMNVGEDLVLNLKAVMMLSGAILGFQVNFVKSYVYHVNEVLSRD